MLYIYIYFNRINAVVVLAWIRANRSIKLNWFAKKQQVIYYD